MTSEWVFDPDRGGIRVPERVRQQVTDRVLRYGKQHFAGRYTWLDIRFHGQFCYIDAYTEPPDTPGWPPDDGFESRDEYLERMRNFPTHLCRLRYFGDDRWTFGFYKYSDNRYELAFFPNGTFFGTPEEAFEVSGEVYL